MQIIIIDMHQLGDGRITRHINYVNRICPTIRINFSQDVTGFNGNQVGFDIPCYSYMLGGCFLKKMITYLGLNVKNKFKDISEHINNCEKTIIHVHDPLLLIFSINLSRKFKYAKIVYDRHESYEIYNKTHWYSYITPHTFEKIVGRKIDGIVSVIYNNNSILKKLFPNADIVIVPNYPCFAEISDELTLSKINNQGDGSTIKCIYFGTLNNKSREIDLILYLSEKMLSKYYDLKFVIGGSTNDKLLLAKFSKLNRMYGDRFKYLGYVPYDYMIQETQTATVGFYFQRFGGSYWAASSPNKLYEYLKCAVIPIVRSPVNCKFLGPDAVICSPDESWDTILAKFEELINEPKEELANRMQKLYSRSENYSFEKVNIEYVKLYENIYGK